MRFKLTIAYDGTNYCGWQVQLNGQSIQTLVQRPLETVLRHPIALTGAGRTDAGVHALGQTAHFDSGSQLQTSRTWKNRPFEVCRHPTSSPTHKGLGSSVGHGLLSQPWQQTSKSSIFPCPGGLQPAPDCEIDSERLRYSVNALLPPDVRVLLIEPVAADFHARYSATGKIYHYHLQLAIPDPMTRLYRMQVFSSFDPELLKKATEYFIGTHDFATFANLSKVKDTVRTIRRIDLVEEPGGFRLEFEGDGFLYKMVRNIVGTLLDIAAKKLSSDALPALFEAKDRRLAGHAAPAQGLFLMKVLYSPLAAGPDFSSTAVAFGLK